MPLTIDSKLKELLNDPGAKAILDKHVPQLAQSNKIKLISGFSFRKLTTFPQANMTPEKLRLIEEDLKSLVEIR